MKEKAPHARMAAFLANKRVQRKTQFSRVRARIPELCVACNVREL